jgi:hypothetical protein
LFKGRGNHAILRAGESLQQRLPITAQDDLDRDYVDASQYPLFYWFDANGDGDYDDAGEMFVDQQSRGCGCDIKPYQGPLLASVK